MQSACEARPSARHAPLAAYAAPVVEGVQEHAFCIHMNDSSRPSPYMLNTRSEEKNTVCQRVRPNLVPCPNLVLPSLEPPAHTFRALESCWHTGGGRGSLTARYRVTNRPAQQTVVLAKSTKLKHGTRLGRTLCYAIQIQPPWRLPLPTRGLVGLYKILFYLKYFVNSLSSIYCHTPHCNAHTIKI